MLFQERFQDYRRVIAVGQLTLWIGILLGQVMVPRIIVRFFSGSTGEALTIGLSLVSAVLIGISIVFNMQGLKLYRRNR